MCTVISAMTSLLDSLRSCSNRLITGALISLLLSWKASTNFNHYNPSAFSLSPAIEQRHRDLACEHKRSIPQLFSLAAAALPGFCLKSACSNSSARRGFLKFPCLSVCLSQRILGLLLLHRHPADVCAFCASSLQVITNCSLTSHSIKMDSVC